MLRWKLKRNRFGSVFQAARALCQLRGDERREHWHQPLDAVVRSLLTIALGMGLTLSAQAGQFSKSIDELHLDIDAGFSLHGLLLRCAGLHQALAELGMSLSDHTLHRSGAAVDLLAPTDPAGVGKFEWINSFTEKEADSIMRSAAGQYKFRILGLRALTGDEDAVPEIVTDDIAACETLVESSRRLFEVIEDE